MNPSIFAASLRVLAERLPERLVGDLQAAEVGDVLAERQLAVDGLVGQRLVAVELLHHEGRPRLVGLPVLVGPPVLQVPVGVVLAARSRRSRASSRAR